MIGRFATIKALVNKSGGMAVWARCRITGISDKNITVVSTQRVQNLKKKMVEGRSTIFDAFSQVEATDIIPRQAIREMTLYAN